MVLPLSIAWVSRTAMLQLLALTEDLDNLLHPRCTTAANFVASHGLRPMYFQAQGPFGMCYLASNDLFEKKP